MAGETALDARSARHVSQCLRCQAEIVRYRRMLRTLHDLRGDPPRPPSTVLADTMSALGADEPARRRLVELAMLAAVAGGAAGGAGVVVWATRRRRPGSL